MKLTNNKVLPFYFEEFEGEYLITNMFRDFMFLSKNEFESFIAGNLVDKELNDELLKKRFIYDGVDEIAAINLSFDYRKQNAFLFEGTSLHIFVVTQECNLGCIYCQVTSNEKTHKGKHMSTETAHKAVDIALQSPAKYLAFEFQGGEPLLNFRIIKEIVEYSKSKNTIKNIEYRLVTNLTLMNEKILDFIKKNKITISVSLDGDESLHNKNRPFKSGRGTYEVVKWWIKKIKSESDIHLSALPTITKYSLENVKQILETYIQLGFNNIFIRNLSPFGAATDKWEDIGYKAENFIQFYKEMLELILHYNTLNIKITENYATMILSKLLKKYSINFMDLRSPCGAGIGQIAYNWDGNIFTCDEGRMLAAEGDLTFKIGDTANDNYSSCLRSDNLKYVVNSSLLDSLIECSDCVFSPICGVCPVYNYKTNGNLFIKMADDYRCNIFKGIYRTIFSKLKENDKITMNIFNSWLE